MAKKKTHKSNLFTSPMDLKLTVEDIDTVEEYRHLSPEEKEQLIDFVFQISTVLYHDYTKTEKQTDEDSVM